MSDAFWVSLFAGIPGMIAALAAAWVAIREIALRKTAESKAKSYEEIGTEAVGHLESLAPKKAQKPVKPLARVVPEHNSPTSMSQKDVADLQTLRARLVAATLELGLPPRQAAPMEK